jgi:hypothetical protein
MLQLHGRFRAFRLHISGVDVPKSIYEIKGAKKVAVKFEVIRKQPVLQVCVAVLRLFLRN